MLGGDTLRMRLHAKNLLALVLVVAAILCLMPMVEGDGAWGAYMNPMNPDRPVYRTNTGTKYHRHSCFYLSQSSIAITLGEALAGRLGPCSRCRPDAGIESYTRGLLLAW